MSNNLVVAASIMIVGGLVCVAGAWYATSFTEYIQTGPFFGTIERKLYAQYGFPLTFTAIFLLAIGSVAAFAITRNSSRNGFREPSERPFSKAWANVSRTTEICPYCSIKIPPQSRFCPNCGHHIEREG